MFISCVSKMRLCPLLLTSLAIQLSSGSIIIKPIINMMRHVREILRNARELRKQFLAVARDIVYNEKVEKKGNNLIAKDDIPARTEEFLLELEDVARRAKLYFKNKIPKDLKLLILEAEKKLDEQRKLQNEDFPSDGISEEETTKTTTKAVKSATENIPISTVTRWFWA